MSDHIQIHVGMDVSHAANASYEDVIEGPPRAEWEAMTEAEREKYLDETAQVVLSNQVNVYAYVDDEEDRP
jgi:hypothetical protein